MKELVKCDLWSEILQPWLPLVGVATVGILRQKQMLAVLVTVIRKDVRKVTTFYLSFSFSAHTVAQVFVFVILGISQHWTGQGGGGVFSRRQITLFKHYHKLYNLEKWFG